MYKKLSDIMATLPKERQEQIIARANQLITEEMILQNIRKAHQLTQQKMVELLGVDQSNILTLEQNTDLLLSTLNNYLETMGGKLQIIAEFPNHPPVIINGFTEMEKELSENVKN